MLYRGDLQLFYPKTSIFAREGLVRLPQHAVHKSLEKPYPLPQLSSRRSPLLTPWVQFSAIPVKTCKPSIQNFDIAREGPVRLPQHAVHKSLEKPYPLPQFSSRRSPLLTPRVQFAAIPVKTCNSSTQKPGRREPDDEHSPAS